METGILIDCSHLSAYYLDMQIIKFAENLGWNGGAYNNMEQIHADWDCYEKMTVPENWDGAENEFFIDYREALDYATEDAIEWLNDSIAQGDCYFEVYDNSLFYSEDSDAIL